MQGVEREGCGQRIAGEGRGEGSELKQEQEEENEECEEDEEKKKGRIRGRAKGIWIRQQAQQQCIAAPESLGSQSWNLIFNCGYPRSELRHVWSLLYAFGLAMSTVHPAAFRPVSPAPPYVMNQFCRLSVSTSL